ncbi:peroxiredoxin [Flexivirga endophytica]|nr:peroxiredoxin [Flexivirga endophytica]
MDAPVGLNGSSVSPRTDDDSASAEAFASYGAGMTTHLYDAALTWTGSTSDYRSYTRSHQVTANNSTLKLSADKAFRGDPTQLNPEALLVAAASSCQLLSFLAVAAQAKVDVISYEDDAEGAMPDEQHPVRISRIVLNPHIRVRGTEPDVVHELLHKAHDQCYIANSLTTDIRLEPTIEVV